TPEKIAAYQKLLPPQPPYSGPVITAITAKQAAEDEARYQEMQRLRNDPDGGLILYTRQMYLANGGGFCGTMANIFGPNQGFDNGIIFAGVPNIGKYVGTPDLPTVQFVDTAGSDAAAFERYKAGLAQQEIESAPRVGSALKSDAEHVAGTFLVQD